MTDIIARAQELAMNGHTPGPWVFQPWGEQNQNGDYAESILLDARGESLTYGLSDNDGTIAAFAPYAVAAIAEETWEYTQEIFFQDKWQPIYEDVWYPTPEECADLWTAIEPWKWNDEPVRIVRRRVSPVEVVE